MELKRVAILLLLVLISAWPVSGKVIYVDGDATGANDGTSWANAHVYLQDGLSDANDSQKPVEIRVAQDIYKPDQGKDQAPGDQEATFQLVNGVSLKGGYAGFGRLDPNARDIHLYETLLSGDIRGNDVDISDPCCLPREPSRMDNNYHVVTGSSTDETAVLDGFTITGGCATESGGGGMCNIKGSPSVKSCTFLKNSAYGYESHAQGGGIYNEYGSPTLVECMFIMNAVDVGIPDHGSGNGGAIANTHSSPKIINCTFVRNVAMGNCGGAIFNSSSNPLLRNCKFIENIVFGGNNHSAGGATYNIDSHPTLTGCLFRNNVATGYDSEYDGGAISNVNSNPTLTDCSFIENLADWGGAISNSNGSPTITRCTFAGNRVNDNGGAICTGGGRPTLADCTFRDNRAYTFGGAICSSASSYLVVTDSTFTSNYAADGGAIYSNFRDNITLRDCTFSANSASRGGAICTNGAWYDDPNSATLIAHCTISGNSAYEGAGLYSGSNRRLLVVNCTLTGNHAAQSGGGFYCYGSQPSVSNCTFAQNLAKKGASLACEWEPSIVQLTNSILWDGGNEVLDSAGSTIDAAFCDVESGYAGTGNLNTDPCFANPGHWDPNGTADDPNDDLWVDGDYHLKSQAGRWNPISQSWVQDALTSPCIDTGDPNSDWSAELWPHGQRINMGAYGGTPQASMSLSEVGNIADLNNDKSVDHSDMKMLANKWSLEEALLPEDLDRNGIVNFADFAIFADNWLWQVKRALAGETLITYVHSPENGNIAVRMQLPESPRYPEGAPIVVVASTWFVEKYTPRFVGFDLKYDPTQVGAIFVTHLWPGKQDPETGAASEGTYDYGGPNSLAALRDTILFASGLLPDVSGYYISELVGMNPLTDNVGLYASSHAGVVATNVLAYHAKDLSCVKYFIGRENPTRDEMYALELGHFDDERNPVVNPYYDPAGYSPNTISIDYSRLGCIQNESYPDGMPYFDVPEGQDYILSGNGPDMQGKRFFSRALTKALFDNEVFTLESWPDDLATPQETEDFWPYRITVNNYHLFKDDLPNLKVMLVFARDDHVLSAPDKPHIHQAYDGFRKTAGLWVRLNADEVYFLALDKTLQEYPENDANTEPQDWMNARQWGYPANYGSELYSHTGSLAGIAEMADRVKANDWTANLDEVLSEYLK